MEKDMILSNTQLFRGIEEQEIPSLFQCLGASKSEYKKGEVILAEGTVTQNVGIILSGQAIISHNDVWGNTSILGKCRPGRSDSGSIREYSGAASADYGICGRGYNSNVSECRGVS